MKNKALVVIDIQNDITKNYREIVENLNKAIDWAIEQEMYVVYICQTTLPLLQRISFPVQKAQKSFRSFMLRVTTFSSRPKQMPLPAKNSVHLLRKTVLRSL